MKTTRIGMLIGALGWLAACRTASDAGAGETTGTDSDSDGDDDDVTVETPCPEGFADCDGERSNGCEASLRTSTGNCGACGASCDAGPGASAICSVGVCGSVCDSPKVGDCDGDASNGCETDLRENVAHCGACDRTCDGICSEGQCGLTTIAEGLDVPRHHAVDATDVYVANSLGTGNGDAAGFIAKVPKTGGEWVVLVEDDGAPGQIVLDDADVYWVREGTSSMAFSDGAIMRVPKAGGDATALASAAGRPSGLALDGTELYWTELGLTPQSGGLYRLDLADAAAQPELVASELASPVDVVIAGGSIYLLAQGTSANDLTDGALLELPRDAGPGTTPTVLAQDLVNPSQATTDGTWVLWCGSGGILRYSIARGDVVQIVLEPNDPPFDVAWDGTRVYWTTAPVLGGTVRASDIDGADAEILATNEVWLWDITTDADAVYYARGSDDTLPGTGAILRFPRR